MRDMQKTNTMICSSLVNLRKKYLENREEAGAIEGAHPTRELVAGWVLRPLSLARRRRSGVGAERAVQFAYVVAGFCAAARSSLI
jgi:hypothetical protein